jgi:hypothetical protein
MLAMVMDSFLKLGDPDTDVERRLREEAVAKARADRRPGVPHDQVRLDMLREIERLKRATY